MAYEKTQQRRIDAGLCKDCGAHRGNEGTSIFCRLCAKNHAKKATERKTRLRKEWDDANLCYGCGAKRDNETIHCTSCRDKLNKQSRAYAAMKRREHMTKGVCKRCGQERYHESNYCRYHFIEGIARPYSIPSVLWEDMLTKLETTDFVCFYTGIPLTPGKNACVDHLYSRSQHPDKISELENLVWCDKWVNRMKGHMSYHEFIALCRTIVKRDEMRLD